MTTPNGGRPGDGDQEEFGRWFRAFFTNEIQPLLDRRQDEIIEARFADMRSWVQTHAGASDPQVVAAQVGEFLSPKLTSQLQPLAETVNKLVSRVDAMQGQPGATAPDSKGASVIEVAESLIDMAVGKLLPAFGQWQMMKRQSVYDVQWAAALRQSDPGMALILGQVLNPDPLINTLPGLLAQNAQQVGSGSYLRGLQTNIDSRKMIANYLAGGGAWPAANSPTSPGPSASPSGGPSPTPTAPSPQSGVAKSGVSMQQKERSRTGTAKKPESRLPSSAGSRSAPKRLSDFLR